MRYLLIIALIVGWSNSKAQDFVVDSTLKEKYRFVDWERNRLDFFGQSPAMKDFFFRLDSLYQGKNEENITIFHIGGSHIQADVYSHRVRRYLHNMNPGMKGSRGVVFPYTLAGTNNPWNYKIEYEGEWEGKRNSVLTDHAQWGMEGIVAHTKDSVATIKISNRKNLKYKYHYNAVKVLHNTWDSSYCLKAIDTTIVSTIIYDDSLNYTLFRLKENVEEFEFEMIRQNSDTSAVFTLFGMELMNDDPGVIYNSIGVNGASFRTYDRCELFEHQLRQYPPDLFIISVGTNDTYVRNFDRNDYKKRYKKFMEMILRANPDAAIILTVPNDSYYRRRYPNPHTAEAAKVIEELAREYDMPVWNFYEIMGGKGSSQRWFRSKLMPADRIHFTHTGYDIKADLFITAFYEAWDSIVGRDSTYLYHTHIDQDSTIRFYSPLADIADWKPEGGGEATTHIVSSGESLGLIANMYGVSVSELMEWNNLTNHIIYPGDDLMVYGSKKPQTNHTPDPKPKRDMQPIVSENGYYWYTIQSGDTLWDIAVERNTTVDRLQSLNPNLDARDLKVGQRIKTGVKK